MINSEYIIKNNSKLEIFNEIDKYMNGMPEYFIKDTYLNNIVDNYQGFVKLIDKAIGFDRYYKTKNDMLFYVIRPDDNLISLIFNSYYFEREHRVLFIYKLLKLSKDYNMSFFDIFLLTNFIVRLNNADENYDDINNDGDDWLWPTIDSKLRDIIDSIKYKTDEKIDNDLNSIYYDSNHIMSNVFINNNIDNNDIIDFCKYYINTVYIANSCGKNSKFSFNDTVINDFKINNKIIDNVLYKICNKEYNNILINDLNNIAYKYNTTFIVVFVLLICDNSYYRIKGINRGIWNDIKQLVNRYINEDINNINIYNINNKENLNNSINSNNINNNVNNVDNIVKQNELYYIKRDKFNIKYKRIYKCVNIINNLNIAIMECIDNSGLNTQQYVLSEEDCNFLNIQYKENLEVFSTKLNWILNK